MTEIDRLLADADREIQKTEEWLTVKEFAAMVRMSERAVRDAIIDGRLDKKYRVERVTRRTTRIVVPRTAA